MIIKEKDKTNTIHAPKDIFNLIKSVMDLEDTKTQEHVWIIGLNARNMVEYVELVGMGDLSSAIVSVRNVYKTALTRAVKGIVIVHNHPSGDVTPSKEDITIANKLKKAGEVLDILFMDSVIVTDTEFSSIKACGGLNK